LRLRAKGDVGGLNWHATIPMQTEGEKLLEGLRTITLSIFARPMF